MPVFSCVKILFRSSERLIPTHFLNNLVYDRGNKTDKVISELDVWGG